MPTSAGNDDLLEIQSTDGTLLGVQCTGQGHGMIEADPRGFVEVVLEFFEL